MNITLSYVPRSMCLYLNGHLAIEVSALGSNMLVSRLIDHPLPDGLDSLAALARNTGRDSMYTTRATPSHDAMLSHLKAHAASIYDELPIRCPQHYDKAVWQGSREQAEQFVVAIQAIE